MCSLPPLSILSCPSFAHRSLDATDQCPAKNGGHRKRSGKAGSRSQRSASKKTRKIAKDGQLDPGAEAEDGTPADGGGEDDEEESWGWDSGKQAACILFHSLDGSKVRRFGGLSML